MSRNLELDKLIARDVYGYNDYELDPKSNYTSNLDNAIDAINYLMSKTDSQSRLLRFEIITEHTLDPRNQIIRLFYVVGCVWTDHNNKKHSVCFDTPNFGDLPKIICQTIKWYFGSVNRHNKE